MHSNINRYEQMTCKLQKAGYKLTPQRMTIMQILSKRTDHPNPDSIYKALKKQLPTTSPATVYKTLAVLKSINEVLEIQYSNESNRYDGVNPLPHPHIYCIKCERFSDLELSANDELLKEIQVHTGYKVHSLNILIGGICPNCQGN